MCVLNASENGIRMLSITRKTEKLKKGDSNITRSFFLKKLIIISDMIKITEDGFVWHVISRSKAEEVFISGLFDVYILYDDDTEGAATSIEDIHSAERRGLRLGIEVGFINEDINNK